MAPQPRNPFTPGFGKHPTVVVGRDEILADAREAFGEDWHPTRKMLLRAHRGSGKTVLLDEIQDIAAAADWLVIQEDAGAQDTSLIDRSLEAEPRETSTRATGLREALETVLGLDTGRPAGVLLSIDEIHEASRADVHAIGNAVQHLDRSGHPIGVLLAGLPPESDIEKEPTFLSRCHAPRIDVLPDTEIERGLIETAATEGWRFDDDALELAVSTSAGFAYMMQLVGWEATKVARQRADPPVIAYGDVVIAIPEAQRTLSRSVLFHIDQRLSPTEKEFLVAMAHDSGPTKMKDIRERMGQTAQYVNVYRNRLLDAGLIRQIKHGYVDVAVPGHRADLRANVGYAAAKASNQRSTS